jgi:hypothetical protein
MTPETAAGQHLEGRHRKQKQAPATMSNLVLPLGHHKETLQILASTKLASIICLDIIIS